MKFEVGKFYMFKFGDLIKTFKVLKITKNNVEFRSYLEKFELNCNSFAKSSKMAMHSVEISKETVELFKVLYE